MLTLKEFFAGKYDDLSEPEILEKIIQEKLSAWKRSCEKTEGDMIVLHESAFGQSLDELLLLGMAIKYAAKNHKQVVVYPSPAASNSGNTT